MSASVDSRILAMKIDNKSFLTGVAATINSLANLKNAMNMQGAGKSMGDLNAATSRFNLGPLGAAVDGISGKFVAMSTVAITALANITNRAVDAGLAWAKSFTVGPILDGLHEYETNLKSIQTVQANTDRPLPEINKALAELNAYSDQTIYNFAEMAKNVGTFTAAGVDLKTSVSSIKGIANMAALSGSSSEQAAAAMYQLSQAIASGKVGLQDWNSVVNAGMGGKKLQNALAQTAIAMGKIDAAQVKGTKSGEQLTIKSKSFRESIMAKPGQESWLTSGILTNGLAALDGRFSKAALSQEQRADGTLKYKTAAEVNNAVLKARNDLEKKGVKYTDEQFKALQQLSDRSFKSATEAKTLGQVFGIAKETIGSGWSASFQNIFGNLKEAKKLFTGMSDTIKGFIEQNALARNNMLAAWKKGGGRADLIEGIKAGFQALFAILKPIKDAFRDIFPAKTATDLISLTAKFRAFMESLKIGSETADGLRRTFRGVFAVFSILWTIVKGVFSAFGQLFGAVGEGSGGILNFTGSIADMLVRFDEFLKKSGIVKAFFTGLGSILALPIKLISLLAGFIGDVFSGFDSGKANAISGAMDEVGNRFEKVTSIGEKISNMFSRLGEILGPVGAAIGKALSGIGAAIADAFSTGDFSQVLDALQTGLFAGLLLLVRKFLKNGLKLNVGGGALDSIAGSFDALTGSLKAMQTNLQSKTLLNIAIAVGVLTASVVALSLIDSGKLKKALAAMAAGFGQLLVAMAVLVKISGSAGFVKVPIMAASMVLLASAVLILTAAIALMGQLKMKTILKGLFGVGAAIAVLGLAIAVIPAKKMTLTAAGLSLIGFALAEIAAAIVIMSLMSWEEMAKGLVGIGGALLVIGAAVQLMGPSLILTGPGLIAVGFALGLIAGVMKVFASMSWKEIRKSMVGLAGSLAILAAGLFAMSFGIVGAAALLIITPALLALAGAMKIMGKMSWSEIGRGLTVFAGALVILAGALFLMNFGIVGAAALLIIAPALAVLATVMKTLGSLSWSQVAIGLTALAGALAIIGIAGLLLTPVIIPLLGLGAALTLIGAGLALAGAGAMLFATAFTLFAAAGTAGVAVVAALIATIPALAAGIAKGIVSFIVTLAASTGQIVAAFTKLLLAMLQSIINVIPKIRQFMVTLINNGLQAIRQTFPNIVTTGFAMLMALLQGLDDNTPAIVKKAVDIAVKFMDKLAQQSDRLIKSGVNLIKTLAVGIAREIAAQAISLGRQAAKIGTEIIKGILGGLDSLKDAVVNKAKAIGGSIISGLGDAVGLGSPSKYAHHIATEVDNGLIEGLDASAKRVNRSAEGVGRGAISALSNTMTLMKNVVPDNMQLNPTVTPILDLTTMTQQANRMSGLLSAPTVSADLSLSEASGISTAVEAARESQNESDSEAPKGDTHIEITQNNNSPKALDEIEIYRGTKNLFSLTKEALKIP